MKISWPWLRVFIYGLVAGVIATIVLYLSTGFLGLPYPPEAIFMLLITPVPGSIQSVAVESLGEYAKYSAFTAASAIYAGLYALVAVLIAALQRKTSLRGSTLTLVTAIALPTLVGLGLVVPLASQLSVLSSVAGWAMIAGLIFFVNLCYGWWVVKRTALPISGMVQAEAKASSKSALTASRRGFLKKAVMAAVALVVAGVAAKIGLSLLSGQPLVTSGTSVPVNPQPPQTSVNTQTTLGNTSSVSDIFGDSRIADLVGSEVTDNRIFYRVDINAIPPQLNIDQWSLTVNGKVNSPLTLDKNALMNLQTKDQYATLECVSNTINPPAALISNAKWTGVPLASLLNQARLSSGAIYVVFHCADGYTVGVPVSRALEPGALLAYMMNDQSLPTEHGFPLRAIVPGLYGMMNAKWITGIEVTDQVYLGYWQERGWTNDARIKTTSIIYYPQTTVQLGGQIPIAGVAFAGDRGISKVEVSTDGGVTWNAATLKTPKSPYSWVLWAVYWKPSTSGTFTILARATDGQGQLQDATVTQPFPNGATGYNSVTVTVS